MARPQPEESPAYYHRYIDYVQADNVNEITARYSPEILTFFQSLGRHAHHAYAQGKWTIQELFQHVIDTERIFCYRALRFSRKDNQPLPGFSENEYVQHSFVSKRTYAQMLEEFNALRKSTDLFYLSLTEDQLKQAGNASGKDVSVNAIVYMTYGHLLHHMSVVKDRYLTTPVS